MSTVEEEEVEEKIEPAPYSRILKYGASEWHYMVVGAIFAAILGAFPLLFAVILSKLLSVSINFSNLNTFKVIIFHSVKALSYYVSL